MITVTVAEAAALQGCSERYIRRQISSGVLIASFDPTSTKKRYLIPIDALPEAAQRKWIEQQSRELPQEIQPAAAKKPPAVPIRTTLEEFSAEQREQIAIWEQILGDWQAGRDGIQDKATFDDDFINAIHMQYPQLSISRDILYRRYRIYKTGNLSGLIDNRGQYRKGQTEIPQPIKEAFEYAYFSDDALPVAKCIEAARLMMKKDHPALLTQFPANDSFYRYVKTLPKPAVTLARDGAKALNDRCGVFVSRLYDDMASNDYWIADGHTLDVISQRDDGSDVRHRLTLSAFIDARSGIYVGWVLTDNPCADATLLALRKGIRRYGVPKNIYVDNGREYLNKDIGGLGHRSKKRSNADPLPTPVLTRLGINMVNALPRNGQAKIIEREFRNFTFLSKLFDTYCGNNPANKPEKLKYELKAGHIPTDGQLIEIVDDMLEGYFNQQVYNGKVASDRGLTRAQVYRKRLPGTVRKAPDEQLNLMMLRSSRLQTIGKNGVYVTVGGKKVWYFDDDLMMQQGRRVYLRYDPDDMSTVRVYDETEMFLQTAPIRRDIELAYGATKEDISHAMSEKRRWQRAVRDKVRAFRAPYADAHGHITMLDLFVGAAKINREAALADPLDGKIIEMVQYNEALPAAAGGNINGHLPVLIDRARMIRNNEQE